MEDLPPQSLVPELASLATKITPKLLIPARVNGRHFPSQYSCNAAATAKNLHRRSTSLHKAGQHVLQVSGCSARNEKGCRSRRCCLGLRAPSPVFAANPWHPSDRLFGSIRTRPKQGETLRSCRSRTCVACDTAGQVPRGCCAKAHPVSSTPLCSTAQPGQKQLCTPASPRETRSTSAPVERLGPDKKEKN